MKEDKKRNFSSKKDILSFIIGIALIGVIIYLGIKIGNSLINAIKSVIDNYPTISVAIITGLLAFVSAIVGRFLENRYTIKNQIRKERQDVYINFLDWIINDLFYGEINKNKNIVSDLRKQQKLMTIYASDNVLKAWSEFKFTVMNSILNKNGLSNGEKMSFYIKNEAPYAEKLILAIRKELGYKNKNIKQYDILKLYINDINEYL